MNLAPQAQHIRILLTTIGLLATLALPGIAQANGYVVDQWAGCGGGFNSGEWDAQGNLYIPCGSPSTINVFDAAGKRTRTVPVGLQVSDVAPSADGRYLYLALGDTAPRRMVRQPDGAYTLDQTWKADAYPMWGSPVSPRGHFVTTDDAGHVYLADGAWSSSSTHTIVKYTAAGQFVTRFGEYANSWNTGTFYWMLTGLVVNGSGTRVYTTEAGNNRVQAFDRRLDGTYGYTSSFGGTAANDAGRTGSCDYAGRRTLAAPYDVGLDRDGNIYVMNTTCKQVLKFTSAGGYLATVDVSLNGQDYPRPHGFAVSHTGSVYVGESQRMMRPVGTAASDLPAAAQAAGQTPATPPAESGAQGSSTGHAGIAVVGTPAATTSPLTSARLTLQPAHRKRGRAAKLSVSCSAACTVDARLAFRAAAVNGAPARWRTAGAARVILTRAGSVSISVPLGRRALSALTRNGRLTVAMRLITTDRNGSASVTRQSVRL